MAESASRIDPISAFRFQVRFNNLPVAGFSECTGLQLETEVYEYAQGGKNDFMLKFPTRT